MAARVLARYLTEAYAGRPITMVIGILDDKPYRAMLKLLLPTCSRVIFTAAKIGRALPAQKLAAASEGRGAGIETQAGCRRGHSAGRGYNSRDGVICIAGSLYVVGEAKAAFGKGLIKFPQ